MSTSSKINIFRLSTPLVVSILFHGLLFVLIGGTIIFEKQLTQTFFEPANITPSVQEDTLIEDELVLEEPQEVALDLPTEELEVEEVSSAAPDFSALAETITSTATIDTGFNTSFSEDAVFEINAVPTSKLEAGTGVGKGLGKVASKVNFFGLQSEGGDIAFVIDLSLSMKHRGRTEKLKEQLTKAIRGMGEGTRLSIICFAGPVWNFGEKPPPKKQNPPKPRWIEITSDSKPQIISEIKGLSHKDLVLGTNWTRGVVQAKRLSQKPSAVFFMTDGNLQGSLPDFKKESKSWAAGGFPINTIVLGAKDVNKSPDIKALKEVASTSKGSFKIVD
ncbi:MAG: vWA domain-containing protein [Verrucomicrobiota bacterium]